MDFFHLLPGCAGGRALKQQKGDEYFAELARTAAQRRTDEERQAIARKGAQVRRERRLQTPRTVVTEAAGIRLVERVIPYYNSLSSSRRRTTPDFVRIELSWSELPRHEQEKRYLIVDESGRFS